MVGFRWLSSGLQTWVRATEIYGFTIEIYGFTHSLRTSLVRATHDAIVVKVKDSRIEDDSITSPEIWKTVNCSIKG